MARRESISSRTRLNWLLDFFVFAGGIIAATTGVQYLFHSGGGFQGGRNQAFGLRGSSGQRIWNDFHTWGGILMIVAALVHFLYHWPWVVMMAKRVVSGLHTRSSRMSRGAKVNVVINVLLASSFLVTAVSGVIFLFAPDGGYQGGTNTAWDFTLIWGRTTWDLIHTWSGVIMLIAAVLHFVIHWGWIVKVTRRFFKSLIPQFGEAPRMKTDSV